MGQGHKMHLQKLNLLSNFWGAIQYFVPDSVNGTNIQENIMPRYARKKSDTGVSHIMLRGINKQTIFEDDEDRVRFLETMDRFKTISLEHFYLNGELLIDGFVHVAYNHELCLDTFICLLISKWLKVISMFFVLFSP